MNIGRNPTARGLESRRIGMFLDLICLPDTAGGSDMNTIAAPVQLNRSAAGEGE
jgi:hypothetical protein